MCSPAASRPSTTGSSASWLSNLQKAIWQRDEATNVSRDILHCLGNYLHGPGASNSTTVHPLTLQFLGPDQEHLQKKFDEQRRRGIMHAQAAVYPVLIPTLLAGCILKMQTSSGWQERDVLGTVLLVFPYIIACFSRCVPGGPSLKHWHVNHVLLFLVSLAGASIIDDHSGALWQGSSSDRTQVVQEKHTGSVYSWVPCIVGLGYVGGYAVLWPAHPLIVSVVAFEHLFWYFLPIIAFEKDGVRLQLIPQMFAVAAIDFFIILGRMRVEFTEKLLLANTELLDRKRDKERKHRNILEAFCRHAVEVHMWLGADANHVMEDGQDSNSGLRGIWPEQDDRSGRGPLLFQDLLATEDDASRFRTAINTSWMQDASEQVQLVPCKVNMYDPGMMQSVRKDCDVFILRSLVDSGVASLQESKFLVALRVKAASPESPRQGLEEEVIPSSPQIQAASIQDAFDRESSDSGSSSDTSLEEGLQADLASRVGSQLSAPASATNTGMLVEALRRNMMEDGTARRAVRLLGRSESWLISSRNVDLGDGCLLGKGGYGYVTLGQFLGLPAAIKRPHLLNGVSSFSPQLLNELRLLRHVRHPHVACFYGAVVSRKLPGSLALVLEFIDGPTLNTYVERNLRANHSSWYRHRVLGGTCLGLMYLHESGSRLVHGDLKPSNVMVSCVGEDPQAKIVDLGLSQKLQVGCQPLGKTIRWCSPEVLDKQFLLTRASDVFSFAYVTYFCLTGQKPWEGWSRTEITEAAKHHAAPLVLDDTRLELLTPMLQMDPKKRCRIREVHSIVAKLSVLDCGRTAFAGFKHTLVSL